MKKLLCIFVLGISVSGCTLSLEETIRRTAVCADAGLDYEIIKNEYDRVMLVNCVKPVPQIRGMQTPRVEKLGGSDPPVTSRADRQRPHGIGLCMAKSALN